MATKTPSRSSVAEPEEITDTKWFGGKNKEQEKHSGHSHQGEDEDAEEATPDTPTPTHKPASPPAVTPLAAPASVASLLTDPNALRGTHFSGPVMSGTMDMPGLPGTGLLGQRFRIGVSSGSFNIPVYFPPGALLLKMFTAVTTPSDATTATVELDQTSGGTVMAAAANLKTAGIQETPITLLPSSTTVQPYGTVWATWLKVTLTGSPTAGLADVIILYSLPAQTLPS